MAQVFHNFAAMRYLSFAIALLILCQTMPAQRLRVATWNIENMFDTCHDEGKNDFEFLPSAPRRWTSGRYWHKLKGISQTLAAMELPAIVALQEVENDTVLRDLTRRTALWSAHYSYVITDSQDERGIDVGLLYLPEQFRLYCSRGVRVPSMEHGLHPTRDLLYAAGVLPAGDTLHVIAVHLPSRRNNNAASRQNRELAVNTILELVDSINSISKAKIIVLGDFNAEPGDAIFSMTSSRLTSIVEQDRNKLRGQMGTYYFRRIWGYLDHILVSPGMKDMVQGRACECRFPFLLRTNRQIPHRTYGGEHYMGGLSDHLPLLADFLFPAPPK